MKIKIAFGSWDEADELTVTALALDADDTVTDHYREMCAEHRAGFGEVREAWLHIPYDAIARLFNVPTIDASVEEES